MVALRATSHATPRTGQPPVAYSWHDKSSTQPRQTVASPNSPTGVFDPHEGDRRRHRAYCDPVVAKALARSVAAGARKRSRPRCELSARSGTAPDRDKMLVSRGMQESPMRLRGSRISSRARAPGAKGRRSLIAQRWSGPMIRTRRLRRGCSAASAAAGGLRRRRPRGRRACGWSGATRRAASGRRQRRRRNDAPSGCPWLAR